MKQPVTCDRRGFLTNTLCVSSIALGFSLCLANGVRGADGPADVPSLPREFRAAWVATVGNIDWPSQPGLSVGDQKREALAILNRLVELNMNAVVLQVRPQADAMYASPLEPWSSFLTGTQGKAPEPFYDPLEFWIEAAHARGLALHAWFNPYRANHPSNQSKLSDRSIVKARPELVVKLGNRGYYWMDPARRGVQDHSAAVVMDVVRRYDVDGVHFDDYFYPYPSYNDNRDFPDGKSWHAYQASGGKLSRDAWRRNAVNQFVSRIYREIKKVKPYVEFGISPFGIWRPGHPPSIRGLDQYNVLYADARLWFNKGWVDYMTPQLYWPIAQIPQSFPVLLGWWNRQNLQRHHLWPGTTLVRSSREGGEIEILNQIMIARGMTPDSPGICMFSMRSLLSEENHLAEQLVKGPFDTQALIPASPWLDDQPPPAPAVNATKPADGVRVSWTPRAGESAFLWVIYSRRGDQWSYEILPGAQHEIVLANGDTPVKRIAVSAVDRSRNESAATAIDVN